MLSTSFFRLSSFLIYDIGPRGGDGKRGGLAQLELPLVVGVEDEQLNGSSHESVTPRQPDNVSDPNSQFLNTRSVVAFSAECLTNEAVTSSTISCGNPGGKAPSR